MSDDKVGTTTDGEPCTLCQKREGYCHHHDGDPSTTGGRPEYEPTDKDRRIVKALASADWPKSEIEQIIGITRKTFNKHFGDLYEYAEERAIATVTATWYEIASSGQNPRQTLAWLERRDPERWQPPKERKKLEHAGDGGGAMEVVIQDSVVEPDGGDDAD